MPRTKKILSPVGHKAHMMKILGLSAKHCMTAAARLPLWPAKSTLSLHKRELSRLVSSAAFGNARNHALLRNERPPIAERTPRPCAEALGLEIVPRQLVGGQMPNRRAIAGCRLLAQ